jgi:hypothetical protein
MTDKERFLKNFSRTYGNIAKSCKSVGIARNTYYNWLKDDKEFNQQIKDCNELLRDNLEMLAFQRAKNNSDRMIIFLLQTKCKDRGYSISKEVVVETVEEPKATLENYNFANLSDEELMVFAKIKREADKNLNQRGGLDLDTILTDRETTIMAKVCQRDYEQSQKK